MIATYAVIIFFISLDRWLKIFILNNQNQPFNLAGDILKINFQANYHIAFSLPLGGQILLIIISLMVGGLIAAAGYCLKQRDFGKLNSLILIILGALSNLFDRFRHGFVVDYLDLKYFTVFNLADAMIAAGALFLILFSNKKRTAGPSLKE